ncbi:MAG: (Fe-S)-binding protein [Desulfobacterales bacterium]|jgi:heterodisulfide reductase subunit D
MPEDRKADPQSSDAAEKEDLKDIPLHSLKMTQLIELDACTRCGECLSWCPVYDQDAKEAIIPRRKVIDFLKIAKAQQGFLAKIMRNEKISHPLKALLGRIFRYRKISKAEIDDFVQNLYECSTCGQCEVVCPAHIETVTLWEELRRVIVQAGYGPLEAQKALVKSVKAFDNPWQQPRAARTKWARRAKKEGLIQALPREIRKTNAKVLLFFGCTAAYDVNVKQVAVNTINILEALNIDYGILGGEEKCCASVLLRMGDPEHERVFKENIDLFNSLGIETLISSCSGCFKTIMQDYPRVAPLNFEVLHTVEFLTRLLKQGQLRFPHPVNRTVTFHDPCHLGRATGGFDAPRMIIDAIPGLKLVEMQRNREYSRCCGAGGGLKAGYPDIQNKMAQRRVREAEETGAEYLVSCCPFCFQGLNVGVNAVESQLMMKDMSSLVAESLLGYDVFQKANEGSAVKVREKEGQSSSPQASRPGAPEVAETGNLDDERAAKKAARERKRAERRAARQKTAPEGSDAGPAAATEKKAVAEAVQGANRTPVQDDRKAAKKAARERRRAERRAVAGKEENRPTAFAQETLAEETSTLATEAKPVGTTEASVTDTVTVATDSQTDKNLERERKRAAKRAAREKEKAARRAARKKT